MDNRIWGGLPDDIIFRVLSWLPVSTIVRSELVCKSWKSYINSSQFCSLQSETLSEINQPWICVSFQFLPSPWRPIATGDGVLCMLCKAPIGFRLYVCNPISKSFSEISLPSNYFRHFFLVSGLFREKTSGSFMVVLVGSELVSEELGGFVLTAKVYNSEMRLWVQSWSFPVNYPLSPWKAISNGVLYCILDQLSCSIVAFNIRSRHWFTLKAQMPEHLTEVRLMDHKNRLVMIGGLGSHGITKEIGIGKLNNSLMEWEMIGRLPEDFCNFFLRTPSRRVKCVGHGSLIYFASKKFPCIAIYNIAQYCWHWVDSLPFMVDPLYHMFTGFCFEAGL
ncbi:F-box/kelch-repeat protein At5g15710-like [Amborella trichopoda]|uniref:F-box/kelch-repeat protein At5g15710-like n=1 Tax=Amborella trichopoda TaxID=13333 RepID=UPI0005D2EFA2|nr:F-box/kelch-repeat protein At5g15710-like [Amborella trichopoda]|eukprot:XP_011626810.1 F-box/kelch-repeat protein At5g15710-like [Amborella trichopoda]